MERARIEKISKALADATRLMIFEAISAKKGMICGELGALRGVTPATVSHHLKILADAGLIECRREGQCVHNRVVPETTAENSRAQAQISRAKHSRARQKCQTSSSVGTDRRHLVRFQRLSALHIAGAPDAADRRCRVFSVDSLRARGSRVSRGHVPHRGEHCARQWTIVWLPAKVC